MANGHGGARPGGGRPSAMAETRKKSLFDKNITEEDWAAIIGKAVDLAKKGDSHARAWLTDHGLGKAKEIKEIETNSKIIEIGYDEIED